MKKSERKTEIRKRAYEYARSGKYSSWLPIEHKISFDDGFREARTELDDQRIRHELDSLCRIATSSEESSRRQDFSQWIDRIVHEVGPRVSEKGFDLRRSLEDSLSVYGSNYSLQIRRRFNSKKLEYSKSFDSKNGIRYRFNFVNVQLDKDFDGMTVEDLEKMIAKIIETADSTAMHI